MGGPIISIPNAERESSNAINSITAFIGISGVYNIDHHFDYESGRGVEEISPLKPSNGYNRKSFLRYTPQRMLQHEVLMLLHQRKRQSPDAETKYNRNGDNNCHSCNHLPSYFPERFLFIHGIEDDTVPFPSTSNAARVFRQCLGGRHYYHDANDGVIVDEYYVPKYGHQDTVVSIMIGDNNPVTSGILSWLLRKNKNSPSRRGERKIIRKRPHSTAKAGVRSKL